MGCGETLVKLILFATNFIFACGGLALLGVGIAGQLNIRVVSDTLEDWNVSVAPITAIVLGSLVFVITFFGCCGAIRESQCMLITYGILMLLLMIAKIALATIIFVSLPTITDEIPQWLNTTFNNQQAVFHDIEKTFHCCGTIGPGAYTNGALPDTCCASPPCTPNTSYGGCNDVLTDFIDLFGLIIGCIAIVIAAIELVAVVFSFCLANHAKNKSRRSRY